MEPDRRKMLEDVREGLTGERKELPSKFFYDQRGSELFERITRLPAYYLTRAELRILRGAVAEWILERAPAALVELGAGSARKTRVLLDAVSRVRKEPLYVPVDVSSEFLATTARSLEDEYPALRVRPMVADISAPFGIEVALERPVLIVLLGSTIGNFPGDRGAELLRRVRGLMREEDRLLLGVDLRPGPEKSVERLERAYNDPGGVTACFNRNVLRVLNRKLGTDFDVEAYRHRAFYDPERAQIEMHLVADGPQRVRLPDGAAIDLPKGASIRTEVSCKYDEASVRELCGRASLTLEEWFLHPEGIYAVAAARTLR